MCPGGELPGSSDARYPLTGARIGDGFASKSRVLTRGDLLASAVETRAVVVENEENKTMNGQKKSDRRIVPRNGSNAPGGKSVTASEMMERPELPFEPADSPRGDVAGADLGMPGPASSAVPMSKVTTRPAPSTTMTMEEVASDENMRKAFEHVASNRGAPGPDRQSVGEVREHVAEIQKKVQEELLAGSYQPG